MNRILGISGSLRAASFNSALLRAAGGMMPAGATLEIASIRGIPSVAERLAAGVAYAAGAALAWGRLLVSRAGSVFDAAGELTDAAMRKQLRDFLAGFVAFAGLGK